MSFKGEAGAIHEARQDAEGKSDVIPKHLQDIVPEPGTDGAAKDTPVIPEEIQALGVPEPLKGAAEQTSEDEESEAATDTRSWKRKAAGFAGTALLELGKAASGYNAVKAWRESRRTAKNLESFEAVLESTLLARRRLLDFTDKVPLKKIEAGSPAEAYATELRGDFKEELNSLRELTKGLSKEKAAAARSQIAEILISNRTRKAEVAEGVKAKYEEDAVAISEGLERSADLIQREKTREVAKGLVAPAAIAASVATFPMVAMGGVLGAAASGVSISAGVLMHKIKTDYMGRRDSKEREARITHKDSKGIRKAINPYNVAVKGFGSWAYGMATLQRKAWLQGLGYAASGAFAVDDVVFESAGRAWAFDKTTEGGSWLFKQGEDFVQETIGEENLEKIGAILQEGKSIGWQGLETANEFLSSYITKENAAHVAQAMHDFLIPPLNAASAESVNLEAFALGETGEATTTAAPAPETAAVAAPEQFAKVVYEVKSGDAGVTYKLAGQYEMFKDLSLREWNAFIDSVNANPDVLKAAGLDGTGRNLNVIYPGEKINLHVLAEHFATQNGIAVPAAEAATAVSAQPAATTAPQPAAAQVTAAAAAPVTTTAVRPSLSDPANGLGEDGKIQRTYRHPDVGGGVDQAVASARAATAAPVESAQQPVTAPISEYAATEAAAIERTVPTEVVIRDLFTPDSDETRLSQALETLGIEADRARTYTLRDGLPKLQLFESGSVQNILPLLEMAGIAESQIGDGDIEEIAFVRAEDGSITLDRLQLTEGSLIADVKSLIPAEHRSHFEGWGGINGYAKNMFGDNTYMIRGDFSADKPLTVPENLPFGTEHKISSFEYDSEAGTYSLSPAGLGSVPGPEHPLLQYATSGVGFEMNVNTGALTVDSANQVNFVELTGPLEKYLASQNFAPENSLVSEITATPQGDAYVLRIGVENADSRAVSYSEFTVRPDELSQFATEVSATVETSSAEVSGENGASPERAEAYGVLRTKLADLLAADSNQVVSGVEQGGTQFLDALEEFGFSRSGIDAASTIAGYGPVEGLYADGELGLHLRGRVGNLFTVDAGQRVVELLGVPADSLDGGIKSMDLVVTDTGFEVRGLYAGNGSKIVDLSVFVPEELAAVAKHIQSAQQLQVFEGVVSIADGIRTDISFSEPLQQLMAERGVPAENEVKSISNLARDGDTYAAIVWHGEPNSTSTVQTQISFTHEEVLALTGAEGGSTAGNQTFVGPGGQEYVLVENGTANAQVFRDYIYAQATEISGSAEPDRFTDAQTEAVRKFLVLDTALGGTAGADRFPATLITALVESGVVPSEVLEAYKEAGGKFFVPAETVAVSRDDLAAQAEALAGVANTLESGVAAVADGSAPAEAVREEAGGIDLGVFDLGDRSTSDAETGVNLGAFDLGAPAAPAEEAGVNLGAFDLAPEPEGGENLDSSEIGNLADQTFDEDGRLYSMSSNHPDGLTNLKEVLAVDIKAEGKVGYVELQPNGEPANVWAVDGTYFNVEDLLGPYQALPADAQVSGIMYPTEPDGEYVFLDTDGEVIELIETD